MAFLDVLLTKYSQLVDAFGNLQPRRKNLQIVGGTITDNASADTSILTFSGSGGGGAAPTLISGYSQPAVGSTVSLNVLTSTFTAGISVAIPGGGYYVVQSITDTSHALAMNMGGPVNAAPSTAVPLGTPVTAVGTTGQLAATPPLEGQAQNYTGGTWTPKGNHTVLNALSFGAKGDNATDDTSALQAWLDAVQSPVSGSNYLPETSTKVALSNGFVTYYKITQPLSVNDQYLISGFTGNVAYDVWGEDRNRVGLSATTYIGPAIISGYMPFNGTYSTESNGITSFAVGGTHGPYIDFGEYWHGDISGLAAFTFRMWYRGSQSPGANGTFTIATSYGSLGPGLESANSFDLSRVNFGSPVVRALLQTSQGLLLCQCPDLTLSTVHQLMVTYDSHSLRLFIDGVLSSTSASTVSAGVITQKWYEEFVVGSGGFVQWPNSQGFTHVSDPSFIALPRIDRACVATSTFTPSITTDLTGVANQTQILVDFAPTNAVSGVPNHPTRQSQMDWILGRTWTQAPNLQGYSNTAVWLQQHQSFGPYYTSYTSIHDMLMRGPGAAIHYFTQLNFNAYNLACYGFSHGIVLDGYCYSGSIGPNINFVGSIGSKAGWSANIILLDGSQFITIKENINSGSGGGNWHIIQGFGDGVYHGGSFPNGFVQGVYAFMSGVVKTLGIAYSDEGRNYKYAGILVGQCTKVDLGCGTPTHSFSSGPAIKVGNCTRLKIGGQWFVGFAGNFLPLISFGSNKNNGIPVRFDGVNTYTSALTSIIDANNPGPVVVGDQEVYGRKPLLVPDGASAYNVWIDDALWGYLQFSTLGSTTSSIITANLPFHYLNKSWYIENVMSGGQQLVFAAPTGSTVTCSAHTAITVFDDGTNLRVTGT